MVQPKFTTSSSNRAIKAGGLCGIIIYGVYQSVFVVKTGQRGVIFNRFSGVKEDVIAEGLHFKNPFTDKVHFFDIRMNAQQVKIFTTSKDNQTIPVKIRVVSRPMEEHLPAIYRSFGTNEDLYARVLPSVVNDSLKDVSKKYNAYEFSTHSEEVNRDLMSKLEPRARQFHIDVADVSVSLQTDGEPSN
eukprot:TRINITY_DN6969_c0_g1_i1.p1 TRINITY_DN6969_c0_g1~~TRINITY_DN6969_c0_g1_i1.p1  ORF type:complete len:188 (-),score=42.31 TRINITY_DN6969_c0_g1_i1:33-596(-)